MRLRIPLTAREASVPPLALAGGALSVGLGGLYLAGLLLTGGEIETGTTVRGVDIGGLSRAEATSKLERHWAQTGSRKLTVTVRARSSRGRPDSASTPGGPSTGRCTPAPIRSA